MNNHKLEAENGNTSEKSCRNGTNVLNGRAREERNKPEDLEKKEQVHAVLLQAAHQILEANEIPSHKPEQNRDQNPGQVMKNTSGLIQKAEKDPLPGQNQEAGDLCRKRVREQERLAEEDPSYHHRLCLARAREALADWLSSEEDYVESMREYEKSVDLYWRLHQENPGDTTILESMHSVLQRMIDNCGQEDWTDSEIDCCEQLLDVLDLLRTEEDQAEIDYEINLTLARLTLICPMVMDDEKALRYADRQIALLENYCQNSNPYSAAGLAKALLRRGEIRMGCGQLRQAEEDFKQCIVLCRLAPELKMTAFFQASALYNLASAADFQNQYDRVFEYLEEAKEICQKQEQPERRIRELFCGTEISLGAWNILFGTDEEAERCFLQAVETAEQLEKEFPGLESREQTRKAMRELAGFYELTSDDPLEFVY